MRPTTGDADARRVILGRAHAGEKDGHRVLLVARSNRNGKIVEAEHAH